MIGSKALRQNRGWIAGTGLVCLSAGGIFVSGCSTATVTDAQTPAKVSPQMAGTKGATSTKKSTKQVAAVDPPAKVRVSDLGDEPQGELTAQASQKKPSPKTGNSVGPAANRRPSATEVAATKSVERPPDEDVDWLVTAGAQRRGAPAPAAQPSAANALAAKPRSNPNGAIAQTSGSSPTSTTAAKPVAKAAAPARPVITPLKTDSQLQKTTESVASIHERRRADGLMKRAYQMFDAGYPEEALRLASIAAELEATEQIKYKRGEERPSEFVAFLQSSAGTNGVPASLAAKRQVAQQSPQKPGQSSDKTSRNSAATAELIASRQAGESVRNLLRSAKNAPQFAGNDKDFGSLRAAANAGRVEVPLPQSPRNADVSIAANDDRGSILERAQKTVAAEAVASGVPSEVAVRRQPSSPTRLAETRAAEMDDSSETDNAGGVEGETLADADVPATEPEATSKLTIASLIGLFAGVAGMFGLRWWRRKEQRHYAAAKDLGLRIQASTEEPPQRLKRAA